MPSAGRCRVRAARRCSRARGGASIRAIEFPGTIAARPPARVAALLGLLRGPVSDVFPSLSLGSETYLRTLQCSPLLQGRLSSLCVSHRGHAASQRSTRLADQIAQQVQLLDSIRASHPSEEVKVVLIGHSVGAWIALEALKQRPEAVNAVHLLFPTVAWIGKTPNAGKLRVSFHVQSSPLSLSLLSLSSRLMKVRRRRTAAVHQRLLPSDLPAAFHPTASSALSPPPPPAHAPATARGRRACHCAPPKSARCGAKRAVDGARGDVDDQKGQGGDEERRRGTGTARLRQGVLGKGRRSELVVARSVAPSRDGGVASLNSWGAGSMDALLDSHASRVRAQP